MNSKIIRVLFPQVAAQWKADKRQYVKETTYAVYAQLCNTFKGSKIIPVEAFANDYISSPFNTQGPPLLLSNYANNSLIIEISRIINYICAPKVL